MEVIDQHQWDTAKLRNVGVHRCHVQHQKIKQAATCEYVHGYDMCTWIRHVL